MPILNKSKDLWSPRSPRDVAGDMNIHQMSSKIMKSQCLKSPEFSNKRSGKFKSLSGSQRLLTLACISKYIKCCLLYTKQKGMYYQAKQTALIRAVINQIKKHLSNISASPALRC